MASTRSTRSLTQSQTAQSRSTAQQAGAKPKTTPKSTAGIRKTQPKKKNKKPVVEPKPWRDPIAAAAAIAAAEAVLLEELEARTCPRKSDREVNTDSENDSAKARPHPAAVAPRKGPKPKSYPRPRDKDKHTDSESEPYSEDLDSDFDSESDADASPEPRPEAPPKREFTIDAAPLVKAPITCHHYALPPSPLYNTHLPLLFTHGAGGTLDAPAVVNFCTGFASASEKKSLCAFQGNSNLSSRVKGFEALLTHWRDALKDEPVKDWNSGKERPVFGGRSMGARAAVMAATQLCTTLRRYQKIERVKLVLISYPLQGPKDVRDQILLDLPDRFEVMFIVGDKDAMCPLDLLEGVRERMRAWSRVVVVKGAGHGMDCGSKTREVGEETGRVAARWVNGEMEEDEGGVVYVGGEE